MPAAVMAPPKAEYAEYSGAVRWIILVALMLGTILEVLDTSIVNVAIPEMMGNLGATLSQISWVSTGYIIANVIVLPLTGWLSTYFGRKRYLTGSIILFTVASFFCGTAHSLGALVFFRILQGAGGAALLSTAQATMMEVFPPKQLGMVQAIFGIGVMVGPTVGPTLGGWITDNYSWPWIFFINLPIGVLAAVMTAMFVRDSKYQKEAGRVDFVGIGLLAIGVGALQTVLEEGNREGWMESGFIQWMSLLAAFGLLLFVVWELRTPSPAVNLRVLRNRGLAAGTIFGAVLGFGLYGGVFILPVYLQQLRHFTAAQTGWILLPGGIATAMMMPVVGKLVSRFVSRNLAAIGALGFIGSMAMLTTLTRDTGPEHLFWPLVLRGASMGLLWVPLTFATLTSLQGKDLAAGTGLFNLARQLGGSAGIAFLSTFLDHRTALHRANLVESVNVYSGAAMERLTALQNGFIAKGAAPDVAHRQALGVLDGIVQGQAAILSFEDAFLVIGVVFFCALPLLLLFKKGRPGGMARSGGH
jgi:MFS transporter, DHA2 family, multidrug resistance protein